MAQRMHGGAALQHFPLATPGFQGLNTEDASSLLGPEWATELVNAVIDESNRLAARKGWLDLTTTPHTSAFKSGFEYQQADGTTELILTTPTEVMRSTNGGISFTNVTGTASFTNGNWTFVNFADKAVGVQEGKAPIVYSGTSFAPVADVNVPTGGVVASFGGRLWISNADGTTMEWCGLLDESDWTSADHGAFNFQNVWKGADTIQAIVPHNGQLVVFGKRNIVFISDGTGSMLGINPTQAFVSDILSGVGCISQHSVQNVNGDLWFLSETGLQSLGRLIQERSSPMNNLSLNVQSALLDDLNDYDLSNLRSAYSPRDRFYLLSLPLASGSAELGTTWVFDTRGRLPDGTARCLGNWTGLIPTVLIERANLDLLAANLANTGELFSYSGQKDDAASYTFLYRSGWTDLGAPGIKKILKRFSGIFFTDADMTVSYKWAWDFSQDFATRTQTFAGAGAGSFWDEGLWGTAVWGGGDPQLQSGKVVPGGTGKYIKFGIDATIDGNQFSLQQLELYAKLGRMG